MDNLGTTLILLLTVMVMSFYTGQTLECFECTSDDRKCPSQGAVERSSTKRKNCESDRCVILTGLSDPSGGWRGCAEDTDIVHRNKPEGCYSTDSGLLVCVCRTALCNGFPMGYIPSKGSRVPGLDIFGGRPKSGGLQLPLMKMAAKFLPDPWWKRTNLIPEAANTTNQRTTPRIGSLPGISRGAVALNKKTLSNKKDNQRANFVQELYDGADNSWITETYREKVNQLNQVWGENTEAHSKVPYVNNSGLTRKFRPANGLVTREVSHTNDSQTHQQFPNDPKDGNKKTILNQLLHELKGKKEEDIQGLLGTSDSRSHPRPDGMQTELLLNTLTKLILAESIKSRMVPPSVPNPPQLQPYASYPIGAFENVKDMRQRNHHSSNYDDDNDRGSRERYRYRGSGRSRMRRLRENRNRYRGKDKRDDDSDEKDDSKEESERRKGSMPKGTTKRPRSSLTQDYIKKGMAILKQNRSSSIITQVPGPKGQYPQWTSTRVAGGVNGGVGQAGKRSPTDARSNGGRMPFYRRGHQQPDGRGFRPQAEAMETYDPPWRTRSTHVLDKGMLGVRTRKRLLNRRKMARNCAVFHSRVTLALGTLTTVIISGLILVTGWIN